MYLCIYEGLSIHAVLDHYSGGMNMNQIGSTINGNKQLKMSNEKVSKLIDITGMHIDKEYLEEVTDANTLVVSGNGKDISTIRIFRVEKIVYDEEDYHLKMQSIIHSIYSIADTMFILITSNGNEVGFYIGVQSDKNVTVAASTLEAGIKGIFPGSSIKNMDSESIKGILSRVKYPGKNEAGTIVGVSQVPAHWEREQNKDNAFSVQGMEHFIDGMKGKSYTALIIASPLGENEIKALKSNLEKLYTSLSVYETYECQYGESEASSSQDTISQTVSDSISDSLTKGVSYGTMQSSGKTKGNMPNVNTHFGFLGLGFGSQKGSFDSSGTQKTDTDQTGRTTTKGNQNGTAHMTGTTVGLNKSLMVSQKNKTVIDILGKIDTQLNRFRDSEVFGLWNCSAFFTAESPEIAIVAANLYKSLVCGDNNGCEKAHISIWDRIRNNNVPEIIRSLRGLVIPSFKLKNGTICRCGSLVNGSELPILMGFPRKSVSGVSAIKMASFGREVHHISPYEYESPLLVMGDVYHMGEKENTPVGLTLDSLTAHTFISGAPGVGKTTFSVNLLATLANNNVKFMVIEPEKGEYKELLGKYPGIQIFTTNPLKYRMLRMNPFAFRDEIHILTHIDRIMDVFSVCWPLYAAQPALLRECIEEAYRRTGWDLGNSIYLYDGKKRFPDFNVLLEVIPEIIKKSKFVGESKGTYEGALLTRIAMLTNGLFGQIFNNEIEISDEEFFENNCIIDLSEAGTAETNSLVMGMMIIRLREYRMVKGITDNKLKHIMLIEEAHNIFPNSSKRSVEGGENLSSKSIEMMSKCLAELRGYGQGFIVVDQRPGAVDDSCISNTSTKIFFRLQEKDDQEVVAASLALTEEQRKELFRFPRRVALVYQDNWIEPVLVEIGKTSNKYKSDSRNGNIISYEEMKRIRGFLIGMLRSMEEKNDYDFEYIKHTLQGIHGLNKGKLDDIINIFKYYDDTFKSYGGRFKNIRIRKEFYRSLVMEIVQCKDILKYLDMSFIDDLVETKEKLVSNQSFIKACQELQQKTLCYLKKYISAPNSSYGEYFNDLDWILELILLDSEDKKLWTIHNCLYGKVKEG